MTEPGCPGTLLSFRPAAVRFLLEEYHSEIPWIHKVKKVYLERKLPSRLHLDIMVHGRGLVARLNRDLLHNRLYFRC